ncbi:hypothetical protein CDL15_Pgr009480 [Punica granatum]|nr:hypothetical protein CDL15_Pgr009480 [Punica granatum]
MEYAMKPTKSDFEESFLFFTVVSSIFFNLLSGNSSPRHCNSKLCVPELDRVIANPFWQTLLLGVRNSLPGHRCTASGQGEAEKRQKEKMKLNP